MRQFLKVKLINQTFQRYCSIEKRKWPRQIFSAIQPTGDVHLGNYLGALKNWVHLQNTEENRVIYAIADLHSITLPQEPQKLNENIFKMVATLLACGIDTNKSLLFLQSMVPQHAELCWLLGTLTTMPGLLNLPQFKDKSQLVKDVPVGLFLYPVLQAADIMLYKTTHVPVGDDQIQQIELAMHLTKIFNNRFGETFPMCDVIVSKSSSRVKSLADPTKKMSKSDASSKSAIYLIDEPNKIIHKVRKSVTDSHKGVAYDTVHRAGTSNLIEIHSAIVGISIEKVVEECEDMDKAKYKGYIAAIICEYLKPIREKIFEYLNNKDYLIKELEKGADQAQEIAENTLEEVKENMGFDLYKIKSKGQITPARAMG